MQPLSRPTAPTSEPATSTATPVETGRVVRLRHGVGISSRDDGLVVVGTDPEQQVALPDTSDVTRVLVELRHGVPVGRTSGPDAAVVGALGRVGLLVDVEEQGLLSAARAATRVRVVAPEAWRAPAEALLDVAGLGVAGRRDPPGTGLTWVVSAGAVPWALHDDLVARDEPTLFTTVLPSRVLVGPFVVPGSTACLRCLDAEAIGVRPPARASAEPPELPGDLPALLLHRALTVAAEDLCAWAEGRQPATWSATLGLVDQLALTRQTWPQHPHCGCCWSTHSMTG